MARSFKKSFEKNRRKTLNEIPEEGNVRLVCVWQNGQASPIDRRIRHKFYIKHIPFSMRLREGDVIELDLPRSPLADQAGLFVRRIGRIDDPFMPTVLAMMQYHLPEKFSERAEKEAQKLAVPDVSKNRVDLRFIPFVTIDGADAKDFDDAVWAEPQKDGWHVMIGIADVSWYVRPDSELDKEAYQRGNSTYFPDRVVPMLPFKLSNGVCSLNPHEPRGALVCEVWLSKTGQKKRHKFHRALIQSVARLTYDQVQAVMDAHEKLPALEKELSALIQVYQLLAKKRQERGTLELDVPETEVVLDEKGHLKGVHLRKQTEAMKLIEEMMILANVSAAETLTESGQGALFRIHDKPSEEKMATLNSFLTSLQEKKVSGSNPADFNVLLESVKGTRKSYTLNRFILRTQAQAVYSPENIGHYGLALEKYTHFTSPIRRYADLLVHRLLVGALKLGDGGISPEQREKLPEMASHISITERQSASAEQAAIDRYFADAMQNRLGDFFVGRISSVSVFGLNVFLDKSGAEGFVPMRSIYGDFFKYEEEKVRLVGQHSGRHYHIGDKVYLQLRECNPATGDLIFRIIPAKKAKL
ncbi:MAG: ribonuclease R family protein [Alphaproteobacteria bacterium]